MARKRKISTTSTTPAPVAAKVVSTKSVAKKPLRRSARRANGLPEDNPNGCPNSVDAEEEDSQHSDGKSSTSLKEESGSAKESDLPPSTVVHKKFGMITCMPHESPVSDASTEQALQAPQVVRAVPFTRRRTRGSSIQDAQRMVEMVLAQEGQVIQHFDDGDQSGNEPDLGQQELSTTSPNCNTGNQDDDTQDPVIVEMVQEVGEGQEVAVMYEDGVMVREVAISWQQESSSSMDVDSAGLQGESTCQVEGIVSDSVVPMDTEMESQDSEDLPMPVLVKEGVPHTPSEESDSQASSTDIIQTRRRRHIRSEVPSRLSPCISNIQTVNESDTSYKDSDDDQIKFESLVGKLTAEEVNKMVLGTNSASYSNSPNTNSETKCAVSEESKPETNSVRSVNAIHDLEGSISEINLDPKKNKTLGANVKKGLTSNVPLPPKAVSAKEMEYSSNSDDNVPPVESSHNRRSWSKTCEKRGSQEKNEGVSKEAPVPVSDETSDDFTTYPSKSQSPEKAERPVTRRRSQIPAGSGKPKTRFNANKTLEEKKKTAAGRGRKSSVDKTCVEKSSSDKSSSERSNSDGGSSDKNSFGKNISDKSSSDKSGSEESTSVKTSTNTNSTDTISADKTSTDTISTDKIGSDKVGSDKVGSDKAGSDKAGFDKVGFDKVGFDKVGFDKVGFDKVGCDKVGCDKVGCDKVGPDKVGPDMVGPDKVGSDKVGSDKVGSDKVGSDKVGSDKVGSDKVGSDEMGSDEMGTDEIGIDKTGTDKICIDKIGTDKSSSDNSGSDKISGDIKRSDKDNPDKANPEKNRSDKSSSDNGNSDSGASNSSTRISPRRTRSVRKATTAAPTTPPTMAESKTGAEAPDSSSASLVSASAMVPPAMGSPSVPLNVHDLSMPVKVKSRWRRSSELEMGGGVPIPDESIIPSMTSIPSPSTDTHPFPSSAPVDPKLELEPTSGGSNIELGTVCTGSPLQADVHEVTSDEPQMDVQAQIDPSDKSDNQGPEVSEPAAEKKDAEEEKETPEQKTDVELPVEEKLRNFEILLENEYRTERMRSKEWRRMVCDCTLTKEEIARGETGCGEDCLNRLLMIECGSRCVLGDLCSNKRFQNLEYGKIEVFRTEKKGYGLRAVDDLPGGTFLMEYVGEVIDGKEFRRRAKEYAKDKNRHYYFMALKSNTIIDATMKGNDSRFINHSCDPNAETQKWTVNGELRVGFFTKRSVSVGEEITFDYQFQNYGKEAQKCFCEAATCRGWIGGEPDKDQGKDWQWKEKESKGKKKERDKRRDDIDLEVEIEKLCASGLKSRAHTLTLCRLMVRAEEPQSRIQLLQLITDGEQACRRLFLDYHGLSLIWSWMMDKGNTADGLQVRLEILKTLKALPIPNKTMLQDSRVLSVVEKWSHSPPAAIAPDRKDRPSLEEESGSDVGEKTEAAGDGQDTEEKTDKCGAADGVGGDLLKESQEDIKPKIEYSPSEDSKSTDDGKPSEGPLLGEDGKALDSVALEGNVLDDKTQEAGAIPKDSAEDTCSASDLAIELLKDWSTLKEVFRIPKKERIEQMKEHEREADKNFGNSLDDEGYEDRSGQNSYDRQWRDRNRKKRSRESPEPERRNRSRYDRSWHDDNARHGWKEMDVRLSKAERRKRFALRVQQEEEEERLRRAAEEQEAEMWRQHEEQCRALGLDPVMTAALYQQSHPQYLDPVTGAWVPYPQHADHNYSQAEYPPEYGHAGQFVGDTPPHLLPGGFPRMFPGRPMAPAPGEPVPPNPGTPATGSPAGQPIPTLSAGQAVPPANVHAPAVQGAPGQVLYPGQEVPLYHQQDGVQAAPFVANLPGEALLQQAPYLPIVPIQLPPKWKSAKDAEGRTYYYHVKTRVSQWEPPLWMPSMPQPAESESSSDTSDDDDDEDSESSEEEAEEKVNVPRALLLQEEEEEEELDEDEEPEEEEEVPAIQQGLGIAAHHQQQMMADPDYPTFSPVLTPSEERKKRRVGLVQERIISPRREEDRTDKKMYKLNKEKVRRQKEKMRKRESAKLAKRRHHGGAKSSLEKPVAVAADTSSDAARRIKDQFRANMAGVIVQHLNPYRKPDCKTGRITNTEDFKHLARKLTHFVMVKELKHCRNVDDLECNDNVKHKARDFIKKYMAKFGEAYQRPKDED